MESTFANRVKQFRQHKGLSQQAFAEQCGLTQGNIAHMENGTEPKQSNVSKLVAGFPDLNPDWLLTDAGTMLRDGRTLSQLPPPVPSKHEEKPAGFPQVPGTATPIEADFVGKYIRQLEEQLAKADADKEYLQGVVTELLGKSPASAHAATPAASERQVVTGFLTAAALVPTGKVVAMWPGYSLAEKAA